MTFRERLQQRIERTGSNLCVGLDPREDLTRGPIEDFVARVVEETAPYAAAFKPNMAYFEAFGARGYQGLENLLARMPKEVPVILDGKRSDIPETQKYYAKACFEALRADAVTLNPYMGFDSIEPFLSYEGKGVYLLGITSNPGAQDIQLQKLEQGRVFDRVQALCEKAASYPASAGLVVGLTNLSEEVLSGIIDVPLLIPGLGAQGGELEVLRRTKRTAPLLINASRSILYGEKGTCAERARQSMEKIRHALHGKSG